MDSKQLRTYFFDLLNSRSDFITAWEGDKKDLESNKLLFLLEKEHELLNRSIELAAVLYKSMERNKQVSCISLIQYWSKTDIIENNSERIVAICNFIWINNKVFNKQEILWATDLLKNLMMSVKSELRDTIKYTYENLNDQFVPSTDTKVCLLIPEFLSGMSFLQPPLGLMIAAGILDSYGINVDLLDNRAYHYDIDEVCGKIENYQIIVINTTPIDQVQNYFLDYRFDLTMKLIHKIRVMYPKKIIIVCGSHGTIKPDLLSQYNLIDIILCGEYEYRLAELIKKQYNNESITNFKNIVYRKGNKYIYTQTDNNECHPNMNDLYYPDYSKIRTKHYYGNVHFNNINVKKRNWSILMVSKGCPYNCSFCFNFYGGNVRRYSINHVLHELNLMKVNGIKDFFIIDQLFTENESYVIELCMKMIEYNYNFSWSCQTRIDCLSEKMLFWMKKAGCKAIWLGVESVNDEVLRLNKKGTTRELILKSLALIKNQGISFDVFFMLGMMGDSVKSLNEIKDFIIENDLPCTKSFMICTPRYGTEMGKCAEKQYPDIGHDFKTLNKYKGLVNNSVTESDIQNIIVELTNYYSHKERA